MPARVTLISQGATLATREAAFPGDEPLEARAFALLRGASETRWRADRVEVSPSLAARQTAAALSLEGVVNPALRDWGHGRWAGQRVADIGASEAENLARWRADPDFAPDGGETRAALSDRAWRWLSEQSATAGPVVAVAPAAAPAATAGGRDVVKMNPGA